MTEVLHVLHAVGLGVLFVGLCAGSGAVAAKWLSLHDAFVVPLGFGCTALAGMISFCGWWISPAVGNVVSLILVGGGVALTASQAAEAKTRSAFRVSLPAIVATLLLAGAWICFVHAAGVPAASRFTNPLPVDDQLPRMLADRLASGDLEGPLVGDWLMSDRPPLQAGVLLLLRPFGAGSGLAHEAVSTLCQLGWLPALAALGYALGIGSRGIATGIFFAATSGFFVLHSVYTWPKLMAASLFITAVAVVLRFNQASDTKPARVAIATGALLALALLAHGGVWFSILALPALPAAWTALRRFGAKGVIILVLVFAAVGAPWSAFKRFVDPPGNRLVKWHLAGAVEVDSRSSLEAIRDSYSEKPAADLWHARVVNFHFIAGFLGRHEGEKWGEYIRRLQFFHFLPSVGLPLLGICWLVFARVRGGATETGAAGLVAHAAATVLVWLSLMFQLGGTIVHHGSFAPVALLMFLGGAAMNRWHVAILSVAAILHVAVFLVGWIVTTPPAGDAHLNPALLAAAAVLMLGALVALRSLSRHSVRFGAQGS
ncbi:MAG TPA: hypothetical protein VMM36_03885 [Opitutaceae bacterium]|nr:hypothetical protein [Opitutaceae bacterium]